MDQQIIFASERFFFVQFNIYISGVCACVCVFDELFIFYVIRFSLSLSFDEVNVPIWIEHLKSHFYMYVYNW